MKTTHFFDRSGNIFQNQHLFYVEINIGAGIYWYHFNEKIKQYIKVNSHSQNKLSGLDSIVYGIKVHK